MKIKTDFVTNSSSTSFILKFTTPIKVAKIIADFFFEDWRFNRQNQPEKIKRHPHEKPVLDWLEKNKKFEGNIFFPWTCNYETYIYDDGWFSNVRVDTCNNIAWSDVLKISQYLTYLDSSISDRDMLFLDLSDFKIKTKDKCFFDYNSDYVKKFGENYTKMFGENK